MKVIINWLLFIGIVLAIWFRGWIGQYLPALGAMGGLQVVFFALSFAFMWVEVLKIGVTKPFNCVKCMAGWSALIIAYLFHTEFWYFYLPAGLFAGALFEAIKMRWL